MSEAYVERDAGGRERLDAGATFFERQAAPVYGLLLFGIAAISSAVLFTSFTYEGALNGRVAAILGIAGAGIWVRRMGLRSAGSGIEAIALFSAISMCAPLGAVLLASSNLPLVDAQLADLDKAWFFGFDRQILAEWIVNQPALFEAVKLVYHSLIIQPSLLIVLLFAAQKDSDGWAFVFAWGVTLLLVLLIFPFFPAAGSPPYFLDFLDTFEGARDGSLRSLGPEALTGIITFPSFHAAAAVLLGWSWWRVPRLRWIGVVLNTAMFWAALVAGHYMVDLIAGGILALIGIHFAERVRRGWELRQG